MDRLLFALALALTARSISLLTGRNRRQLQKVPEGMSILCQPPGKRYILYALGVVVMAVVLFFGVLYLLDGAPESARPMWGLCIAVAVLTLGVCILGGNIQAKDCVYYDEEKFQVNRPFREPQVYPWSEVGTIRGSFDREITLYQRDGTKILAAGVGMVHYEGFCAEVSGQHDGILPDTAQRTSTEMRSALWAGVLFAGGHGNFDAAGISGNAGVCRGSRISPAAPAKRTVRMVQPLVRADQRHSRNHCTGRFLQYKSVVFPGGPGAEISPAEKAGSFLERNSEDRAGHDPETRKTNMEMAAAFYKGEGVSNRFGVSHRRKRWLLDRTFEKCQKV